MTARSGPLSATVAALEKSASSQDLAMENGAFESGGKCIGVAIFKPKTAENLPAIIVLHGAGGIDSGNAYVRQIASLVAANGYATFLVEYFDRTGTVYADESMMRRNADKWLATVDDAVTFVSAHDNINPRRIAIFGYSLGGYLAIAQSSRDPRIRAVVELAGGIEPDLARTVKRLPPMLIIHGRNDGRVPFARATELERLALKLGTHVETEFLVNERHILSPIAAFHAIARALEFFQTHLNGS
jgi:dienelactone hydrolase